jgi:hypothetical protein
MSHNRGDHPFARILAVALCFTLLALGALPATFSVGAPPPAFAADCEGDECQSPPPPPDDPAPGTAVVQGPPNPPVHFPKPHHKKPGKPHEKGHHRHVGHRGAR